MLLIIKTLINITFAGLFQPNNTLANIKHRIELKSNFSMDEMRLVYKGKEYDDNVTLSSIGVIEGDTLMFVCKLRGGGMVFTDLEKKAENSKFSNNAPKWRVCIIGLNLEGLCKNSCCDAFNEFVIMKIGTNKTKSDYFDLTDQDWLVSKCRCPACGEYVTPLTCGFANCWWKYNGSKCLRYDIVYSPWKQVVNHYTRFSSEKSDIVEWEMLKIFVVNNEIYNQTFDIELIKEINSKLNELKIENLPVNITAV
jgi:hypothetical protein